MQVRQLCEAFLRQAALHPRSGPAAACGSGRLHPRRSRIRRPSRCLLHDTPSSA
jgi:hypothetical protein